MLTTPNKKMKQLSTRSQLQVNSFVRQACQLDKSVSTKVGPKVYTHARQNHREHTHRRTRTYISYSSTYLHRSRPDTRHSKTASCVFNKVARAPMATSHGELFPSGERPDRPLCTRSPRHSSPPRTLSQPLLQREASKTAKYFNYCSKLNAEHWAQSS
jgi:hypothetical protein